ncbi:MAG: DUF4424 family protein [Sphingomonadaceae bacterium]
MNIRLVVYALLLLALSPLPALANDSEAEIGIGGIVLLKRSPALVMESEDLYISEKIVRVKYRFRNPTDEAITTTVAFPMPPQPRAFHDRWYDMDTPQDFTDFAFNTRVDGQPVRLTRIDRAMVGTRDVTDAIAAQGWPMYWMGEDGFTDLFEKMPEAEQRKWEAEGLMVEQEMFDYRPMPAWDLVTFFVREQVFPANSTVSVEHEYVPMLGGSVGGALHKSVREDSPEILEAYHEAYCIDDYFLRGFDRRIQPTKPDHIVYYGETWIGYVLSSGANWNGPIGDFRLVIDKGDPDNLVSFCMDGVKKIAPTQFEVRKSDFTPTTDLQILIATFTEIED